MKVSDDLEVIVPQTTLLTPYKTVLRPGIAALVLELEAESRFWVQIGPKLGMHFPPPQKTLFTLN